MVEPSLHVTLAGLAVVASLVVVVGLAPSARAAAATPETVAFCGQQLSLEAKLVSCTKNVESLAPLAQLTKLTWLQLRNVPNTKQLAALTGLETLEIHTLPSLEPIGALKQLKKLKVEFLTAKHLKGIEGAAALQEFSVSSTKVTDLQPLAKVTNLEKLRIGGEFSSLAALEKLRLVALAVRSKALTSIASVAKMPYLRLISFNSSAVADLGPLSTIPGLRSVSFHTTPVADLRPLAKLTQLTKVVMSHTKVTNLAPLAKLTNLQFLALNGTAVADLRPLAKLVKITRLEVMGIPAKDLSPIGRLTAIKQLFCSHTKANNYSFLRHLHRMYYLRIEESGFRDDGVLLKHRQLKAIFVSAGQVSVRMRRKLRGKITLM